jgi:hypothetical protein
MLLDHPRCRMTEVFRNHDQRHSVHDGVTYPGVPQTVKIDRGEIFAR